MGAAAGNGFLQGALHIICSAPCGWTLGVALKAARVRLQASSVPPGRDVETPFKFIAQRHADAYAAAVKRYEAGGGKR